MSLNRLPAAPSPTEAVTHDVFALTDEQILEIEPELGAVSEPQDVEVTAASDAARAGTRSVQDAQAGTPTESNASATTGPFAAEDVRALGELYPGGLSQAKTAAERARTLDEIDAAYFGSANSTPEQISASRAQLAQRMMRENPVAFREMVFAGLRALESAGVAPAGNPAKDVQASSSVVAQHAAPLQGSTPHHANTDRPREDVAPYAAFERAANDELERSVGASIDRTIAHALPNLSKEEGANSAGAGPGTAVPLRERLASSVCQDVEAALKGDRQLGEQIAQILAAKRFDDSTRAQVVRLINDRAQQLVPGSARRVIGEWTSATLAAHGAKSERSAATASRREVAPAASGPTGATSQDQRAIPAAAGKPRSIDSARNDRAGRKSVDYRKLSDEQIVDL